MNTLTRWEQLKTELHESAFLFDRRGNPVAADLATTIAARIDEVLAEEAGLQAGAGLPRTNAGTSAA